jgi:MFS superfamily sulfate permease-like transporter
MASSTETATADVDGKVFPHVAQDVQEERLLKEGAANSSAPGTVGAGSSYAFSALLKNDLLAGFTVGLVLVPQAVAYAVLAECPPIQGLYTSLVPLLVFAPLTSSRHVAIGPFALVSLLVADTVSVVVSPSDTAAYGSAIALLTLMVGAMHMAMRLLRLDVIATFLSDPVLDGFQSASGILIASSQLKNVLGIAIPRAELPATLWYAASHWHQVNLAAVGCTVVSFLVMEATKSLNKAHCKGFKLPEQLVPMAGASALTWLLALDQTWGLHVVASRCRRSPTWTS